MSTLWILGAGGHAKVVISTARAAGHHEIRLADDDASRLGASIMGVKIQDSITTVLEDPNARAVLAIGDNGVRHTLANRARCQFVSLVHPGATVDPTSLLEPGTVVFAGAVVQPDTRIGAHTIVNTGASIDHDCVVGACVHIAPGGRVAGSVRLDEGVFVGIGAAIVPGITIGAWARVGAGAVVIRDVADHTTVVGVPARPIQR